MASPIPQPGSKGWKARERAKAELRQVIAAGLRQRAREVDGSRTIAEELYYAADMIEGGDFERRAG